MSKEMEKLYREDQRLVSKWHKEYSGKDVFKINKDLRRKVDELMKKGKVRTGKDYFIAAIIFHHAYNISTSRRALSYARRAFDKGYKRGKWLIASATDRLLQLQRKPQKFGTQVVDMSAKNLKLYTLDSKTTDDERREYGLPTLKELKKYYGIK